MNLVVNTNRIIAALLRDSVSRRILFSGKADFCTLETAKDEVSKHRDYLLKKSKLSQAEFDTALRLIMAKMTIHPKEGIEEPVYREARKIMDAIDPDDTQFIALALATSNDGIWTEDKHFLKQKEVPVWSTSRLLKRLNL